MRILAIDTTSAAGSIALLDDGALIEQRVIVAPEGFSPVIFGEIEALLARHNWPLQSVDGFASAAGPGSFTGVRVSLTTVKGLAEAMGRPAFGVSNLEAGASLGSAPLRAPWLDARRGEVYGAVYSDNLDLLRPESVGKLDEWTASLPAGAELIPCDGVPLAAAVGRCALRRFLAGERRDPASLDANYVRRSDAELFWNDPATSSRPA